MNLNDPNIINANFIGIIEQLSFKQLLNMAVNRETEQRVRSYLQDKSVLESNTPIYLPVHFFSNYHKLETLLGIGLIIDNVNDIEVLNTMPNLMYAAFQINHDSNWVNCLINQTISLLQKRPYFHNAMYVFETNNVIIIVHQGQAEIISSEYMELIIPCHSSQLTVQSVYIKDKLNSLVKEMAAILNVQLAFDHKILPQTITAMTNLIDRKQLSELIRKYSIDQSIEYHYYYSPAISMLFYCLFRPSLHNEANNLYSIDSISIDRLSIK